MNTGDILQFKLMDVKKDLPSQEENDGCVIAFVPLEGLQMCKYYNGSKTWESLVTRKTVKVTEWLKKI